MHPRTLRLWAGALTTSLLLLAAARAAAQPSPSIVVQERGEVGQILTDAQGMTLYLFTRDSPGTTTCYGGCAMAWPPLLVQGDVSLPDGVPGELGIAPRTDGTLQLTYNGWPLYYWASDRQPGDTTGQGVGDVWWVVSPEPAPTVGVRTSADMGTFLTDRSGRSLYLFTKDSPGMTTCYEQCAVAWPPLLTADAPTGPNALSDGLGTVTRSDGTRQVTFQGWPLYFFQRDAQPGDISGQKVGGVWFLISPDGKAIGQ
jgi:predicted lipoprotein with Yx(FWY)xxD motif